MKEVRAFLYGSARRDDNLYLIRLSRFLHCIGNSLIHGELIAVVVFKSTMPRSRRIRPSFGAASALFSLEGVLLHIL